MKRQRTNPKATLRSLLVTLGLIMLGSLLGLAWYLLRGESSTPPVATTSSAAVAFVDDATCLTCHTDQATAWRNSHHAQAMQPANAQTVLGDFTDVTFDDGFMTARFFKKGERFFVNTAGPDGKATDFAVQYTFGVDPLQQYLLALPRGRFQALTIAWDVTQRKWFNLYPNQKIAPGDALHWTGRRFTWNSFCADCHSTAVQLNYDVTHDQYQTTWAAINVGCQACHGPGANHNEWAQQKPLPTQTGEGTVDATTVPPLTRGRVGGGEMGLVVNTRHTDAHAVVESCAGCHARRATINTPAQPGQPLLDHYVPELLNPGIYHVDGQIQDEVFEYGSFTQSKMYQRGVSCLDCHDPHSGQLRRPANALCTACHQPNPPTARFPTLPANVYDSPSHHFHPADSPGAHCVNCHMPSKNYMVIDARRDHSLRIPRPDFSVAYGTPNACTQCHTDRDAAWAVTTMTQWYGTAWQERPHFAAALAAGRRGAPTALAALQTLAQDPLQPAIARATALHLLPQWGAASTPILTAALRDENALVRTTAATALQALPASQKSPALSPLLTDSVRAVRVAAARSLADATATFSGTQMQTFAAALAEYEAAQLALADQPEGHANLGNLYATQGNIAAAEKSYQQALALSPHFWPAANSLAVLYVQTKRLDAAQAVLQTAISVTPDQGELYYSLGLLLVEQQKPQEALPQLARAAQLLPTEARVQYNYGLLLQQLGQPAPAAAALQQALALRPDDVDFLYALATFYLKQQPTQARPYAERLVQLYPTAAQTQQVVALLKQP